MTVLRLVPPPVPRPTRHVCVESQALRIQREWDRGLRTSWRSDAPAVDWFTWHGRAIVRLVLGGAGFFLTCSLLTEVPIIETGRFFRGRH